MALVKCFPDHYGSATIFNTGCAGPEDSSNDLVVIPQVKIFRETIRKVVITITPGATPTEEISSGKLAPRIFPNPGNGMIFIEPDWLDVSILDMNGKEIKRFNTVLPGQTLDASSLPTGLYFLNITTNDGKTLAGKLIKL